MMCCGNGIVSSIGRHVVLKKGHICISVSYIIGMMNFETYYKNLQICNLLVLSKHNLMFCCCSEDKVQTRKEVEQSSNSALSFLSWP